jgi:membrane-associated phospholipid phosphatase
MRLWILSVMLVILFPIEQGSAQTDSRPPLPAPAAKSELRDNSTPLVPGAEPHEYQLTLLPAGEDPENRLLKPFMQHLALDQKQFWTAPFQWKRQDAQFLLPFAAFTGGLIAGDSWISRQVSDKPSQISRSKSISDYATFSLIGAAGASYFWGHFVHNDHLRETGLLAGEAALNSTAVTYLSKSMTQRPRPFDGNGNGTFFRGGASFPSEHSAIAWSVASVIAHEYPGTLTKLAAYGLASTVTLTRVTGKQHFASDVVIGSALGWYFARQVYRAHHDPELGGAGWSDFVSAEDSDKGERARNPANMGSPHVPIDSWVYPAFERLAAWGYLQTDMLGQRPWTRIECARLLEEASMLMPGDGESGGDAAHIYKALEIEFQPEQARLDGGKNLEFHLDSLYTRVTGISGTPLTDSYNFGTTLTNDNGRPFQEGANIYSGISGYGTVGPLAFYVRAEYQHVPFAPGFSAAVRQAVANVEGVPPAPYTPFQEINRPRVIEGYVSFTFKNTEIAVGKQAQWWAPTESDSLMWSTNAEPINMVRISTLEPFKLPSIFHWLGPVSTEFFLGQLQGQQYILDTSGIVGPGLLRPQPFIHGQKFSFKPTANLEFGFSRTVIFGGQGHPFTLGTFWNSFTSTGSSLAANGGVDVTHDPGDRRSGFDASYRVPYLRKWATVYVDAFSEDDVSPFASPSRAAWSPGVYLSEFPRFSKLDFRAEGVFTDVQGLPAGTNYQNIVYRSGYTNEGNIIGSWVGRAGRGIQLRSTYWLSPESKIQVGYRHQGVSRDFLQGGWLDDASLHSDIRLQRDLFFSGTMQYEHWHFPLLSAQTQSNWTVSIGLTFRPKWGSRIP